jgi:S1-C subfamily serine protease
MRIPVTCPFCTKKGTLPEAMGGQRVKCAGCHRAFVVGATKSVAKPPSGLLAALVDDDETADDDRPLRLEPRRQTARTERPHSSATAAYAGIAVGGVCALLLAVVIVLLLSRSNERPRDEWARRESVSPVGETPEPGPKPPAPREETESERAAALAQRKKAMEDATVYLKLSSGGRPMGSGTGFVIRADKDAVLLATNRHVADAETDDGGNASITAVFRSGQGAALEQSLPAEIVAIDHSREINHDLAILRVRGLTRPIVPINPSVVTVPSLQMKYSAYGFPFGDLINVSKGNPGITVTGGTVSSLLKDDHGQLVSLKLDGGLHPGNSGGPLVDEQGRLIGVAVAKLQGVDNIGLAIPASDLREVLAGRVGMMRLVISKSKTSTPELQVKAQLVDPNACIRGVKLRIAPAQTAAQLGPAADGSWPPLPNAAPVDLRLDKFVAKGQAHVSLGQAGPDARRVVIQTSHVDHSGKTIHSAPRSWVLPETDGPISDGGKLEELRKRLQRKSLAKLGPLVEDADPKTANDCELTKDAKQHLITISIPANQAFSLSPRVQSKQNKPVHNAPRTMAEIDGDFAAFVEVSGDINPGLDPIKDPRGRHLGICHQSAGLLLYQDKDNFMRLERACRTQGAMQIRELLVEVVRHGKEFVYYYIPLPGDPKAPMILYIVRQGDRIKCLFSFDDGRSLGIFHDFTLDYPAKVKIGLCASNLSKKSFTARYESFVLVDDKTTLTEEFGD